MINSVFQALLANREAPHAFLNQWGLKFIFADVLYRCGGQPSQSTDTNSLQQTIQGRRPSDTVYAISSKTGRVSVSSSDIIPNPTIFADGQWLKAAQRYTPGGTPVLGRSV